MARNKINTEEQNTLLKRDPSKNNSQDSDKLRKAVHRSEIFLFALYKQKEVTS